MGPDQPLHPLVVHPPAAPAQLGMHPWGAADAMAAGMEATDLADQPDLLPMALRRSLAAQA
jgi:hypothetical protein